MKTPGLSGNGITNNTVSVMNKTLEYFGYELHPLPANIATTENGIVAVEATPWVGHPEATAHDEWNYYNFPRQGTYKLGETTVGYLFHENILRVETDDSLWLYGTFSPEDASRLEHAVFDDALGMVKAFYLAFEHKPVTLALSSDATNKIYSMQDFLLVARPKSWL